MSFLFSTLCIRAVRGALEIDFYLLTYFLSDKDGRDLRGGLSVPSARGLSLLGLLAKTVIPLADSYRLLPFCGSS